jgi:hypothetical protein
MQFFEAFFLKKPGQMQAAPSLSLLGSDEGERLARA